MTLKDFLQTLSTEDRESFAAKVGTTAGHLRNVSYGYRACAESLAIEIERESARQVTCEELCPDANWAFIRGTAKAPKRARA